MKRKIKDIVVFLLFMAAATQIGCGTVEEENKILPVSEETYEVPEEQSEHKELWTTDMRGSILQEDDSFLYFCSTYRVTKINKETLGSEILWENKEAAEKVSEYLYSEGNGLLLEDKLYFIEAWQEADKECRALSVIKTNGTGYQRIENLTDGYDFVTVEDTMVLVDGTLYIGIYIYEEEVENKEFVFCYQVYEDGTLSEAIAMQDTRNYQKLPEGYSEPCFYLTNSKLYATESEKLFGYMLLENADGTLLQWKPDTKEEVAMPFEDCALLGYNSKYLLCSSYNPDLLYLVNQETMLSEPLLEYPYEITVLGMDEEYVYIVNTDYEEKKETRYEKISLEDGERSLIFTRELRQDSAYYDAMYRMDYVLKNGYLYYVGDEDYRFYLMRRNLANPEKEEILGEAFYDTGIADVGELVSCYEEIYSMFDQEVQLATIDLEWLKVDERFAGASAINEYMQQHHQAIYDYEKNLTAEMDETIKDDTLYGILPYFYTSNLEEITYYDEKYLSFCQAEYEYMGGAHGMPYRVGFTFHLETGERLKLPDVIGNSEEELKEIVTGYFVKLMNEYPEIGFWDDSEEYVRENINFDSRFYLTEEGIVFYFGPYEISSFAAGFQWVTIPYSEFEMLLW